MTESTSREHGRRDFLKDIALAGSVALAAKFAELPAFAATDWKKQVGLQLYIVRDQFATNMEGTLAKLAEIGYKVVEPTSYGGLEPKAFRAMLDKYGLMAVSTHAGASGTGADLEKQLEGHQIMGFKYTMISGGGGGRGAAAPGSAPAAPRGPAAAPPAAQAARGGGQPQTVESVKRRAQQTNENGKIAKKFGMKIQIHNHSGEFALLDDGKTTTFDVLLAETNPELVTLQLDIGWAAVAGQNILEMFKKNPGRFELWHVKDMREIKYMTPQMSMAERQRAANIVPVGLGEIDYKSIFAAAELSGMKYYVIEQDSAAAWGDSVAAAKVSYQNLVKVLG